MSRFNLPDIEFVRSDADENETFLVNIVESMMNITLTDADPRRQFIKSLSYYFAVKDNSTDYSAKQLLLSYAEDDFLDHLGVDIPRLEPTFATTTMRFELNVPTGQEQVIEMGTQATPGNEVFFEITEPVIVTPEMSFVDIEFICMESGIVGNDYLPNQINQLVKPLPWVKKVYNTTKSSGGAEWEDDDRYAERIRLSNEAYSTAGPEDAYKFHAKSASQLIADVEVRLTEEEVVEVIPLLVGGELPTPEILVLVENACNGKTIRPLTDRVISAMPEVISYNIDVTYYLPAEKESKLD